MTDAEAERTRKIRGLVVGFEKYDDAIERAQGDIREWRKSQDKWAAELVELHGGDTAAVAALLGMTEAQLYKRINPFPVCPGCDGEGRSCREICAADWIRANREKEGT